MSKLLSRAAEGALKSPAAIEKFLDRLSKQLPQVDRICVSVVEDGQVRFVQVAQSPVLDYALGRVDRSFAADNSALAAYIKGASAVVNVDLHQTQGDDVAAMRQVLGSGVHLPIAVSGQPGVISYWSKEKNAFPEAAVNFLRGNCACRSRQLGDVSTATTRPLRSPDLPLA